MVNKSKLFQVFEKKNDNIPIIYTKYILYIKNMKN